MALPMKFPCSRSNELYGLIEYYDAIFSREGLIKKECEFRSNKLSLILDLIRTAGVCDNGNVYDNSETSDDGESNLLSLIIDAWRLQVPEKTIKQRNYELQLILHSINGIKEKINGLGKIGEEYNEFRLNALILSYLPIIPSDLRLEEVSRIYNLINEAWDKSLLLVDTESIAVRLDAFSRETAFDSI